MRLFKAVMKLTTRNTVKTPMQKDLGFLKISEVTYLTSVLNSDQDV